MIVRVTWTDGETETYLRGSLLMDRVDDVIHFHSVPDGALVGVLEPDEWRKLELEKEEDDYA